MSDDQMAALKARLANDPVFAAQLRAATSRAEAERVLAAHGLDAATLSGQSSGILTDEALETIAGAGPMPVTSSLHCAPSGPGPQNCSW